MRSTLTDTFTENHAAVSARDPLSHTTIHRYRVRLHHVSIGGCLDGAALLDWIHRAAHATATRWSGRCCVAASVANFHLNRPVGAGELVEVHACLVYTGRSSVHVLVTVYAGDPAGAQGCQTAQCPMVFVAVDEVGDPVAVHQWTPVTMLELQRQRQARVRIRTRKRIEEAIAAQAYASSGTAPSTTRHIIVSRADVNSYGVVHGGRVMRWIDDAANVCAADWSGFRGLTSYVAAIRFCRPVSAGDHLEVATRIVHTGPRSTHVGVRVTATDMVTGMTHVAAEGLVVVVSLDDRGGARPVPQWTPDCDDDRRLDRHARHLVELRQFFEPYPIVAGFPPALAGSGVECERGVEELEL